MKKLFLDAIYNPDYLNPDLTPDIPAKRYKVTKIINSTLYNIGAIVPTAELDELDTDEWTFTIT